MYKETDVSETNANVHVETYNYYEQPTICGTVYVSGCVQRISKEGGARCYCLRNMLLEEHAA